MTVTEPKVDEPDIGSPDDCAHYCKAGEIARAAVEGGYVKALCGVEFMPIRNPDDYPTCQRCVELLNQYGNREDN